MTQVAVSGATGFIGRHVLAELTRRGIPCVALTRNMSTSGYTSAAAVKRISLDILNPPETPFLHSGRPDVLVHLAWGGLPNYQSLEHLVRELPAQFRFLHEMVEGGLKKILVTGTCLEYGRQSGPLSASMRTRPVNAYGLAKDVLRKQLQLLQTMHPFELTWGRLFYMFGEGQSRNSLYASLSRAAAEGISEVSMSGGEQLRDYLPVETVASQIVDLAVESPGRGIVNICSGRPISIRRLVEQWISDFGWQISPRFGMLPYPDYEPMAFWGIPYSEPQSEARSIASPTGIQPD